MNIKISAAFVLVGCLPLYAALSDSAALSKARQMWGPLATISSIRNSNASNWTRQVGIESTNCQTPFTVFGSGFNTWDAAFADAALRPIPMSGPFKGTVQLQMDAWDDVGVTRFRFYIDGVQQPELTQPSKPQMTATQNFDTRTIANGIHVLCARAFDAGSNFGASRAFLFRVDQTIASGPPVWVTDVAQNGNNPPGFAIRSGVIVQR